MRYGQLTAKEFPPNRGNRLIQEEYHMNQAGAVAIKGMNFPKLNQIGIHPLGAIVRDFEGKLAKVRETGIGIIQSGTITTKGAAGRKHGTLTGASFGV
jgi:hypothetical protein